MEQTVKETFMKAIQAQPDDSTAEELLKELAFHRMILRGLKDSDAGRTVTHEEMGKRIKSWAKK